MSYNGPDEYLSRIHATADGEVLSNRAPCYRGFNEPYVHLVPRRAAIPYRMSPFNPLEDQDPSRTPRCHAPNLTTPTLRSEYSTFQPQVPISTESLLPAVVGTDTPPIRYTTHSTNGYPTPSQFVSIPSGAPRDFDAPSGSEKITTLGANLSTGAGAPYPSIPVPIAVEEVTLPPEKRVLSSCDFGGGLRLADALKKDFSRMSGGDSTRRAFPSQDFAAKLAFWFMFGVVGNDFRPRRKQVTVVTTKKSVIEQPSKARLAYLVAREMERYLKECNLRRKPFPYGLDDIALRRIDLTSKGTIRPRLYVYVRRPRSARVISAATF